MMQADMFRRATTETCAPEPDIFLRRCFLRSRYLLYIYIYLSILLYIPPKKTESPFFQNMIYLQVQ